MGAEFVLQLSADWAIFANRHQWMLCKSRKRLAGRDWDPRAYIGSTKSKLRSTMLKMNLILTPANEEVLENWPESFLDWRETYVDYLNRP